VLRVGHPFLHKLLSVGLLVMSGHRARLPPPRAPHHFPQFRVRTLARGFLLLYHFAAAS
jgi:hypothetical protein